MTLFDCYGIYVGWDRTVSALHITSYCGSYQVQLGRILLGCDWFFRESYARTQRSHPSGEDRQNDLEALTHPGVVAGKGL